MPRTSKRSAPAAPPTLADLPGVLLERLFLLLPAFWRPAFAATCIHLRQAACQARGRALLRQAPRCGRRWLQAGCHCMCLRLGCPRQLPGALCNTAVHTPPLAACPWQPHADSAPPAAPLSGRHLAWIHGRPLQG